MNDPSSPPWKPPWLLRGHESNRSDYEGIEKPGNFLFHLPSKSLIRGAIVVHPIHDEFLAGCAVGNTHPPLEDAFGNLKGDGNAFRLVDRHLSHSCGSCNSDVRTGKIPIEQ